MMVPARTKLITRHGHHILHAHFDIKLTDMCWKFSVGEKLCNYHTIYSSCMLMPTLSSTHQERATQ